MLIFARNIFMVLHKLKFSREPKTHRNMNGKLNLALLTLFVLFTLVLSRGRRGVAPNCGRNEVSDECFSSTQPTCENPHPKAFLKDCNAGCRCKHGFVEHHDSSEMKRSCIRYEECPKDCGENEVEDDCFSSTQPTCENPDPESFTEDCISGCRCERGFVEHHDSQGKRLCIKPEECPKT